MLAFAASRTRANTAPIWTRIAIVCAIFAVLRYFDTQMAVSGAFRDFAQSAGLRGCWRRSLYPPCHSSEPRNTANQTEARLRRVRHTILSTVPAPALDRALDDPRFVARLTPQAGEARVGRGRAFLRLEVVETDAD